MNETIKNIVTRRSVKKYQDKAVPTELVEEIVKAGTYAPSGMNKQSAIIIAVTNKELRDRLSRINLDIVTGRGLKTSEVNISGFCKREIWFRQISLLFRSAPHLCRSAF